MKTTLAHTTEKFSDGSIAYKIVAGRTCLGQALKGKHGFSFASNTENVPNVFVQLTMRDLKERVKNSIPETLATKLDEENEKADHPTIKDAIAWTGMSHTSVHLYLEEIRTYHPEMHRQNFGGYMIRRHMESLSDQFDWAVRWLEKNRKVGNYRYVSDAEWEAGRRLN